MILSAIALQQYYFEELGFALDADFDATQNGQSVGAAPLAPEQLHIDVGLAVSEADARARVYRLHISSAAASGILPVAFRARVTGHFQIGADCPDEDVEKASNANAPALLYGVAREAIAALTGRSPWPPMCLPAVHFLDLSFAPDEKDTAAKALAPKKRRAAKTAKRRD